MQSLTGSILALDLNVIKNRKEQGAAFPSRLDGKCSLISPELMFHVLSGP